MNLLFGNPDVALRGPWDKTNLIEVAPTARDLSKGLFDYHLDFPGSAIRPGCAYDHWSRRINEGHAPVAYAHVVAQPDRPDELALQYWFFYVYNDFNNKHEGDWELVQLDFAAPSAQAALRTHPTVVGYSQHEGAERADWGDEKLELVGGTHPVVYPALGSHANYYTSALHLGRSAAQGVGCDDTRGPSREIRPRVELIPSDRAAAVRAFPWIAYDGRWGEQHASFYNGPTGPNAKLPWTEPITWADTKWHANSFTVPAGSSVGTTATGFFCGAVAVGSGLLTSAVGDPSPLYVGFVALFALILWLASRTQWHPSAPFRLARRRRWGAILNASRRMYVDHLRLFLGIGLLFFPLGLLISGVQYLVFRLGALNGLINSAGSTNAVVVFLATAIGVVFTVFGLAIVNAATALAMVELDAGRDPHALAMYRRVLPKLGVLLGVVLIAAVASGILDLLTIGIVLTLWIVPRWLLFPHAVVLEEATAVGALRRSAQLVRGSWWRVTSLLLFVTVLSLLLGPLVGTLLLFVTSASFNFVNLVSSVVYAFVLPYAAITTTYLYFDLRVADERRAAVAETDGVLPAEIPVAGSS